MFRRRYVIWALGAACVAAVVAVGTLGPGRTAYKVWQGERQLRSGNAHAKRWTLRELAKLRVNKADRLLTGALRASDSVVREAAGYAIFRAKRRDLANDLLLAAQQEQTGWVRSSLYGFWVLTVGAEAASKESRFLENPDPWTRLGGAWALTRLGQVDAAEAIFDLATSSDADLRRTAQQNLKFLSVPMAALIGQDLPDFLALAGYWSAEQVEAMHEWWRRHVTGKLLAHSFRQRTSKSKHFLAVNRLQSRWERHADTFLRTRKTPGNTQK